MLRLSPRLILAITAIVGSLAAIAVAADPPSHHGWQRSRGSRAPTGVIVSGVRQGTRRLAVAKSGSTWFATEAWHTPDVAMYMSSPVLARGTLFGHSSKRKGQFVAMDPDTGTVLWATEGRNATSASVVAAGNHLVYLTTESQMIVTPVDPAAFNEVRRYTVAPSTVYAQPIVLRNQVIVRDASSVTQWTLSPGAI